MRKLAAGRGSVNHDESPPVPARQAPGRGERGPAPDPRCRPGPAARPGQLPGLHRGRGGQAGRRGPGHRLLPVRLEGRAAGSGLRRPGRGRRHGRAGGRLHRPRPPGRAAPVHRCLRPVLGGGPAGDAPAAGAGRARPGRGGGDLRARSATAGRAGRPGRPGTGRPGRARRCAADAPRAHQLRDLRCGGLPDRDPAAAVLLVSGLADTVLASPQAVRSSADDPARPAPGRPAASRPARR